MKTLFTLLLVLCIPFSGFNQISTIVIKNRLVIPENPQTDLIPINKTELSKVELITSKLGDITGYTIIFKTDKTNLFTKTLEKNNLEPHIRDLLMSVQPGTHFLLENVTIKMPKDEGLVVMNYEFILED